MDRQIESAETNGNAGPAPTLQPEPGHSSKSRHLMCRTALWGIAGFLGCGYFAWLAFARVMRQEYDWPHDSWTVATYLVWIVLLIGLSLDTRCLRERAFFGVLVINFVIGCALSLWQMVPDTSVRIARMGTGALWVVAGLVSLTTVGRAKVIRDTEQKS